MCMQSNEAWPDARRFQGKDAILSGPAARHRRRGAHTAHMAGFGKIIG